MKTFLSRSAKETSRLAERILKKTLSRRGLIIALKGDLGAGKTTFVKSFLKAAGIKKQVTSPTFLIFRPYKLNDKKHNFIYHVDAYRLKSVKEAALLGLKGIVNDPKNIVLIEWPEKIKSLLPKKTIWLEFQHGRKENERIIKLK